MKQYNCKDNENVIKFYAGDDGQLDELAFGDTFGIGGYTVISLEDLTEALKQKGYELIKGK